MVPLSDVEFGPENATENDVRFPSKWIEPPEIKDCLRRGCWIVTGEKGSGKSAIQKALRELHSAEYFVTPLVDFDEVTFQALDENLIRLSDTTNLPAGVTLSNYWQYSIIVELMRACADKDPAIYGDLFKSDAARDHKQMPLSERLSTLLEEAWNLVDTFTASRENRPDAKANLIASGGLSARLLHDLRRFPLSPEFELLKTEFFRRLEENDHNILLILDGFDTLITYDTKPSSVQLIFSSLINALLALRRNGTLPSLVGIKALIPHDRYMNMALRDSDKVASLHASISWSNETLKEFVQRRIAITPKIKPGPFENLWGQVMPTLVFNSTYKIEENSFDYILRHTMLRPRQLQIHLSALSAKYRERVIDPSMLPRSISESSRNLAQFFIDEYKLDHPHLDRFILEIFGHKDNVMEFKQFRDLVATGILRFNGPNSGIDVDEKIDVLYAMGFFGVVQFVEPGSHMQEPYYPPTKEARRHYIDFFFRKRIRKVSSRLVDTSLIAIHPIFLHFADLKPHPTLLVG